MKRWPITDAGEIQFELMKEFGEDTKIIKDFLSGIIKGIAKRTLEYYNLTKGRDHAFLDSEKGIQSTVTLSIADLTPIFKSEFPTWRAYSTTKSGNLDYWIFYKNIAFAMELKYSHKGFYRGDCCDDKGIYKDFNKALAQLENIEENKLLLFMDGTKAITKMVFHPIIFFSDAGRLQNGFIDSLEKYQSNIEQSFNTLFDKTRANKKGYKFNQELNLKALWFLDKNIIYLKAGRKERNYVYPAIGFIGHIDYIKC